jgi:MFS family permease
MRGKQVSDCRNNINWGKIRVNTMNAGLIFIILFGLNLGFVFMNLPPIIDDLRILYSVSYTGVSVLISALLWTHAALQVPAGMIADRIGVRSALLISVSLLLFGNVLAGLIPDLTFALTGRVITGIGTGLGFIAAMKLLTVIVPARRQASSYQAYFAAAFSFGCVMGYLIVPVITQLSWTMTHLVPASACLVLLALLTNLPRSCSQHEDSALVPLSRLLFVPTVWILGAYHALSFGTVLALGSWIPSLLSEIWERQTAKDLAWVGALMMFISGIARIAGGQVLFKFPARSIAHSSLAVLSGLFASLCLVRSPEVVLALALVAATAASVNFGALFYLAAKITPSNSLATVFGFVNFLANVGAIVFTLLFGIVKDYTGSFRWGFGFLTALAAATLCCGLVVFVRTPEEKKAVNKQDETANRQAAG